MLLLRDISILFDSGRRRLYEVTEGLDGRHDDYRFTLRSGFAIFDACTTRHLSWNGKLPYDGMDDGSNQHWSDTHIHCYGLVYDVEGLSTVP